MYLISTLAILNIYVKFQGVRCVIAWMPQISEIFDTSRRLQQTKKNRNNDDPVEGRQISV